MKSSTGNNPNFCLSGRVFERSISESMLSIEDFFEISADNGFRCVELRDSQIGADAPTASIDNILRLSERHKVSIEMITLRKGRLDREDEYPVYIRHLEFARNIGCSQMKVSGNNFDMLRKAAEAAANVGIKIGTNNHIGTAWESIHGTVGYLEKISHPNYHCIFDPSHLWLQREDLNPLALDGLINFISYIVIQDYIEGQGEGFRILAKRSVRESSCCELGNVGYPEIIRHILEKRPGIPMGLVWLGGNSDLKSLKTSLKKHLVLYCNGRQL